MPHGEPESACRPRSGGRRSLMLNKSRVANKQNLCVTRSGEDSSTCTHLIRIQQIVKKIWPANLIIWYLCNRMHLQFSWQQIAKKKWTWTHVGFGALQMCVYAVLNTPRCSSCILHGVIVYRDEYYGSMHFFQIQCVSFIKTEKNAHLHKNKFWPTNNWVLWRIEKIYTVSPQKILFFQ